jgi:hypothetical protein
VPETANEPILWRRNFVALPSAPHGAEQWRIVGETRQRPALLPFFETGERLLGFPTV